jgi:hypothetical protein
MELFRPVTAGGVALILAAIGLVAALGPTSGASEGLGTTRAPGPEAPCAEGGAPNTDSTTCSKSRLAEGRRLFEREEFGGNGRTCATCHSGPDGTIDPAEVVRRLRSDPDDPLFVHDGLDDFAAGTSRIAASATILVRRRLPRGVSLTHDPSASSVVVARGVPSTVNTPALDPALMYDIRDPTLQEQALGAIQGHALNTIAPTSEELDLIAELQQTDPRFFSSSALRSFAFGGPPPELPLGRTAAEKRGREFFIDAPWNPPSKKGLCAFCHSGPMLNTANEFVEAATGAPPGFRAFDIGVSTRNLMNNPVVSYDVTDVCGTTVTVESPDPGIMLTGVYDVPMLARLLPPESTCILHPAFFANMHKTPQLWDVEHTAPYFHDNSAASLEEVLEQYNFMFDSQLGFPITDGNVELTETDIQDIVAFLKLL